MHPTKRRRIGLATAAPNKPFRSPLRVDQGRCNASAEPQDDKASQPPGSVMSINLSHPRKSSVNETSTPILDTSKQSADVQYATDTQTFPPSTITTEVVTRPSQDHATLHRQYRSLSLQLKELTKALDTVTQALKIVQPDQDGKLEGLIKKWQDICRQATEDLFSTAAQRVRQMGGFGVWRNECARSQQEHLWSGDAEADEDLLSEEQREELEIAREEAKVESEKYLQTTDAAVLDEEGDDSFTIGTMLRQLNIDPEVVGYDVKAQAWME